MYKIELTGDEIITLVNSLETAEWCALNVVNGGPSLEREEAYENYKKVSKLHDKIKEIANT